MFDLECNICGHVVKDNGSIYFGLKEYDCWCGGKLTNDKMRLIRKASDIVLENVANMILGFAREYVSPAKPETGDVNEKTE